METGAGTTCPDCGAGLFNVGAQGHEGAIYQVCENLACDLAVPLTDGTPDRMTLTRRYVTLHNDARASRITAEQATS